MQLSFTDRTYLVTGGGSGIGKGVAAGLVESGAHVMIIGRTADRLAAAAEDITAAAPAGKNLPPKDLPPLLVAGPRVAAAARSAAAASLSALALAACACLPWKVVPATRHSELRLIRGAKEGGKGAA